MSGGKFVTSHLMYGKSGSGKLMQYRKNEPDRGQSERKGFAPRFRKEL